MKDIHLDLMESARRALSEENFRNVTEARRNFLNYIFHELRSPLNSLTIGIEILEKSDDLKEGDLESLGLMKDASTFMSDTLNNVLSIQKIEEGTLLHAHVEVFVLYFLPIDRQAGAGYVGVLHQRCRYEGEGSPARRTTAEAHPTGTTQIFFLLMFICFSVIVVYCLRSGAEKGPLGPGGTGTASNTSSEIWSATPSSSLRKKPT